MNVVKSFSFDSKEAKIIEEAERISKSEGGFSAWLFGLIKEAVKEHGDGNPAFSLDHFLDPDFVACPAFHRSGESWESYLSNLYGDDFKKWDLQLQRLLNLSNKFHTLRHYERKKT